MAFSDNIKPFLLKLSDGDNPYRVWVINHYTKFIEERPANRKLRASMIKLKKLCEDNPDVVPWLVSKLRLSREDLYTEELNPDSKRHEYTSNEKGSMYHCGRYTQDHVLGCLQRLFVELAGPITCFGSSMLKPPSFGKSRANQRPVPDPNVIGYTETSGAILALKPKFLGDIHPIEEFKRVAESLRVHHKGYALKFFEGNVPALLKEAMEWKIPQDPDDIEPVVFDSTPVLSDSKP